MEIWKRIAIIIVSLILTFIFTFPTLALFVGLVMATYHKWVSGIFILMCSWHIAKAVEKKYLERKNEH